MIAEPLVFTIGGVARNLVRINQDGYSSEWLLIVANIEYRAFVRNTTFKDKGRGVTVDRHNVELRQTTTNALPIPPTVYKAYFVMEVDRGTTVSDSVNHTAALMGTAVASSNALLTKIGGSES